MRSVGLALLLAAVSANAFGAFHPSAPCHEHPCPICPTCHVCPKPPEPEPMTCPALIDHLQADDADAALLKMAYSAGDATAFLTYIKDAKPVGYHTDLIPEASDAVQTNAPVMDGKSGDVDFPHGNLKPLVTVGEYFPGNGEFHVGVPDGMGAYLHDDATVRYVVQSESYGPLLYESFPWAVNDGAASFTGSHIQYVDIDREMLSTFMEHNRSAAPMIKHAGNLVSKAYNLKGEPVGPRATSGPTMTGAHLSNTDAAGNFVVGNSAPTPPTYADWLMQSLCSAHLEVKHQWGPTYGVEDSLYLTNEEWNSVPAGVDYVGLSAHALNLATKELWAVGAFGLGGYEKIVEINSGSSTYVVFSPSGYNGDFGNVESTLTAKRNAAYGPRSDNTSWVGSSNVVPARIYIGKKGFNAHGEAATDFLSRNGLAYGQNYGFATNVASTTGGLYRDAWHKDATRMNGDTVTGGFFPIEWRWNGTVTNFEHDGAWGFQEMPVGAPSGTTFWTPSGPNSAGSKSEHNTPDPTGAHAFYQGSTAGYVGHYSFPTIGTLLQSLTGDDFPASVPADYKMLVGELDVSGQIVLGGKGIRADSNDQTLMADSTNGNGKVTFEDIDGIEALSSPTGTHLIIQEDGGNHFGERMFITKARTDGTPMSFNFIAQSGGKRNTRMLAGVGIPAGTASDANSHEFSGIFDLSGLLFKSGTSFYVSASDTGYKKRLADALVPINDKLIAIGLQAHSMSNGVIAGFRCDRGGQVLIYKPHLTMA